MVFWGGWEMLLGWGGRIIGELKGGGMGDWVMGVGMVGGLGD